MVQAASRTCFLFEPALAIGIGREFRPQNFNRDLAAEVRVARAIDLTHAADPETAADFESAKTIPDGEAHGKVG
jgi:hypothetical protein